MKQAVYQCPAALRASPRVNGSTLEKKIQECILGDKLRGKGG
jgi:hypothetical protein